MKLKNKIKSFYRHNRKCHGMWHTALLTFMTLTPPYGVQTILFTLFLSYSVILWINERRADTLKRTYDIMIHKYEQYIAESHERVMVMAKIADENIEKAVAYDRMMADRDYVECE